MPRSIAFDDPNDTCMYTPLQLQPVTAFRYGMSTWARWIAEYVTGFPALVRDHGLGAVVVGGYMTYLRPCGFFDCDGVRVVGRVTVLHRRAFFRASYDVFATGGALDGEKIAEGIGIVRPLFVAKEPGLGAVPIPVPPQFIERMQPDEIHEDVKAPRPVAAVVARVATQAPLAEATVRTFCSRALCEVADQWSFVEVPSFGSHGRETLIIAEGARVPALRRGLRDPLKECLVEYGKPAFAFDELDIHTRAFALDDDLVFVHAIRGTSDGAERAMIVERF
jgi:hypothetical protein